MHSLKIMIYDDRWDSRLGRHIHHDSRSLRYLYPRKDIPIQSMRHFSYTESLDQGSLGSCTGNAAVKCLTYDPFYPLIPLKIDESLATMVYSEATALDPYPGQWQPTDTGSDGLSVAKVCKSKGFISGYQHATSMDVLLTALMSQPVIVGTNWYDGMFTPASSGLLDVSGSVAGGHEYVLDEYNVEADVIGMQNSWGEAWGLDGRAYVHRSDLDRLLDEDGDCTIFTPLNEPAPEPAPIDPVEEFQIAARKHLKNSHSFNQKLREYLDHINQ